MPPPPPPPPPQNHPPPNTSPEKPRKTATKPFPQCPIPHENQSQSQIPRDRSQPHATPPEPSAAFHSPPQFFSHLFNEGLIFCFIPCYNFVFLSTAFQTNDFVVQLVLSFHKIWVRGG